MPSQRRSIAEHHSNLADLRIQLEGSLETLEAARDDFTWLDAALERWDEHLPMERDRVTALLAREAELGTVLMKCGRHDELRPLVDEVGQLRLALTAKVKDVAEAVAPGTGTSLTGGLAHLLTLATAPVQGLRHGERPLLEVERASGESVFPVFVGVAGLALMAVHLGVGLGALVLALLLSSMLRRRELVSLYADRLLVRQAHARAWTLPLNSIRPGGVRLLGDVVHLEGDRLYEVQLPLTRARELAVRVELGAAPLLRAANPGEATDALVLDAELGPLGGERTKGAMLLCAGGATFVAQGRADAAWLELTGRPVSLNLTPAELLRDLARLDGPRREAALRQVGRVSGCAAWWTDLRRAKAAISTQTLRLRNGPDELVAHVPLEAAPRVEELTRAWPAPE